MTSVARRLMVALALSCSCRLSGLPRKHIPGAVTDSTGAVLPGAVVTVVHDATGNTFQASPTSAAPTGCRSGSARSR